MAKFTDDTISLPRLISFSDGVFAIAVTLLVFNLKVPQIPAADAHLLLRRFIKEMLPHFATYILTFLLVALYWLFHHRMLNLVTRVDGPFIWMNIFYLLTISFIPFPSALFGAYPNEVFCFVLYLGSMMLVGSLSLLMVWYATRNNRLVNRELPAVMIKYLLFRISISLMVFLTAIPLAFYSIRLAEFFLLVLFPIHWLTKKYFEKLAKE